MRRFYDFDQAGWLRGKLHSVSSASGRTVNMQYSSLGQLQGVVWEQEGHRREFVYDWLAEGPNAGLLASVTLLVNERPVRRARYAYYETTQSGGTAGDLADAAVEG